MRKLHDLPFILCNEMNSVHANLLNSKGDSEIYFVIIIISSVFVIILAFVVIFVVVVVHVVIFHFATLFQGTSTMLSLTSTL